MNNQEKIQKALILSQEERNFNYTKGKIILFHLEDEYIECDNELVVKIPIEFLGDNSWTWNKKIKWPNVQEGRYFVHIYSEKLSESVNIKIYHKNNNNLHMVID
jgi:hypothetical protein